jgi:tetratricopeptide (TPR) repeat protein
MNKLRSLYPNSVNSVRYSKAPVFIARDDFADADEELGKIVNQGEKTEVVYALMGQTAVSLTQGKVDEAKRRAQQSIESAKSLGDAGWEKMAHQNMAYLDRLSGNLPEALQEAEEACQNYQNEGIYGLGALHLRALITLEMGRMEEFEKRLAEIKGLVEQERYPKLMRAYFHLLGQRELRKGRIEDATDYFLKALGLLPSPMGKSNADIDSAQYFYSLADAYDRSGRWSQALDILKRIPPYWEQRFNSGDIYARTFYRAAKLYELCSGWSGKTADQIKDDRAKSIQNYRKFLSLWKDADPIFGAQVEDAKKRLAALEAE